MDNYIKVKNYVESKQCILLTSFEEFEEIRKMVCKNYYQYVRIRFIGICSHESSAVYTNFYKRNTGIRCKLCVKEYMSVYLKTHNHTNITELSGISIISSILEDRYDIQRMFEGCKADLAIKLKSESSNIWIPIQVKSITSISHGMYSCTMNNNDYSDMFIFIVAINDNKIWLIPGSLIGKISRINISKRSKYNKYMVTNDTIHCKIIEYMPEINRLDLDTINRPITCQQQKEVIYSNKRRHYLHYLIQSQSILQGSVTDFTIGRYKIQEKVLVHVSSRNRLQCSIKRNNGTINKIRKFKPYCIGENDYYWLHSPIDDRFWIIPEIILHEKGYIQSQNKQKVKTTILFNTDSYAKHIEWLKKYEYNYVEHDKNTIMSLFV